MGTREPMIIRQGENRIVVQVPGLSDPAALKALLGQTARTSSWFDPTADPARRRKGLRLRVQSWFHGPIPKRMASAVWR